MRGAVRAWLVCLALILGVVFMSSRAFAIEQKRATLISYDSIKNVVQLNIDGAVYTTKLHQLCVIARQDGTKGDPSELMPGLTVKVWVDKIPPTVVYAIQLISTPQVVDPRAGKHYPKGVTPDNAPIRGYATYPYEMAKEYYRSPTSSDWERMSAWWPWSFYIAGPVVMDPFGYWWGPLTLYGYYNPLYYYGYYTLDALQKEPNLPEFRYLMAIEDSLYRSSEQKATGREENIVTSSPRVAQSYSGNYYSYVPYMNYMYMPNVPYMSYMTYSSQGQAYQPASRPDLLAQASNVKGSYQMPMLQFGPSSGSYKEYDVKLLGVDLSTSRLIVEGAKESYVFTAQTNFMIKRKGSFKYDVIALEEASRLAYPARARIRGYYLNPNTFLATDVIVYQ